MNKAATQIAASSIQPESTRAAGCRRGTALLLLAGLVVPLFSGCSSMFGNHSINAIPVGRVPGEILAAERKNDFEDISMLRLRQDKPESYLLDEGDVLGIFIPTVLGNDDELPPVHYSEDPTLPPSVGFPVPVGEDGKLQLPLIDPVDVRNKTLIEAADAIREAYSTPRQIVPEDEHILVTLIRRRTVTVLVVREESGGVADVTKRGTGHIVELNAYENDVLHALNKTGGLPGTDAQNEVLIFRGMWDQAAGCDQSLCDYCMDYCQDPCFCNEAPKPDPPNLTRIPLRFHPSRPPQFSQQDVILQEGDIVVIRSRDKETFFTAGLLGGGEFPLPRDKDLDVIGAIAIAGGPLGNIGTGVGAIGGRGNNAGMSGRGGGGGGYCQPSELIVIRELPCGNQITMKVDLNRALASRNERILVKPGDVLMLRYTLAEEIGNVALSLVQFNFLFNGFNGGGF